MRADVIVLAAGGLGTPPILRRSGIECEPRLFVDPVLSVAGLLPRAEHCYEIEMPFVVQRDHYILSPYFDFLSFIFNRPWRYPAGDTVSMMVKLADENTGSAAGRRIHKALTADDQARLDGAVVLARDILRHLGVPEKTMTLGTLYAGHPGGMLPLTAELAETFHDARLPDNVYVADATLFPKSLGNPPILTIIAMAKRVARVCVERYGEDVPVSSMGAHAVVGA